MSYIYTGQTLTGGTLQNVLPNIDIDLPLNHNCNSYRCIFLFLVSCTSCLIIASVVLISMQVAYILHPSILDLSLSEIPQDLEDVLVMKLDAPSEADSESYGWQRVGREFGVSRDELNYFKIEYLRDNGSSTKLLLDKLGCQGKTISDLIVVLQSSRVEFHGVAKLIIQRLLITA